MTIVAWWLRRKGDMEYVVVNKWNLKEAWSTPAIFYIPVGNLRLSTDDENNMRESVKSIFIALGDNAVEAFFDDDVLVLQKDMKTDLIAQIKEARQRVNDRAVVGSAISIITCFRLYYLTNEAIKFYLLKFFNYITNLSRCPSGGRDVISKLLATVNVGETKVKDLIGRARM